MSDDASELLFSYGTLQLEPVQRALFGRRLGGEPDALVGHRLDRIAIDDPKVVETSGETHHRIARATGDPMDRVDGQVLRLTPAELARADAYETDDYVRVRTTLASGLDCWVYAAPSSLPWRIELLEDPRLVMVDGAGDFTMADLIARVTQTLAFAREHECSRFVFDDRQVVPRVSVGEIYAMPQAFERLGWSRAMRVANVYDGKRPAQANDYRVFSGLSVNRGFAYCLFTELEPAIEWAASR